jgi:hypothetical protein
VRYRGEIVGTHRLDLLVAGLLIVELKALAALAPAHTIVLRSYLKGVEPTFRLVAELRDAGAHREARLRGRAHRITTNRNLGRKEPGNHEAEPGIWNSWLP